MPLASHDAANLLVLPVLVPLTSAAASLLAWRSVRVQRRIGVIGAGLHLAAGLGLLAMVWRRGIVVYQAGGWPAPFGITLVADYLSAIMVLLAGIVGFSVAVYSLDSVDVRRQAFGFYPLLHLLIMGVSGAFLTGDMFNLYVWFEVMLIASFVLLALGGERLQLEGGLKYVTLNLIASALFLAGLGLLYGETGTLNMADLNVKLPAAIPPGLATTVAMLFLIAFSIKAAVFPLFFWLPDSYHTPPVAVSAVFSGLLTKVGVYALLRCFTLVFVQDVGYTHTIILVAAGFTMVTGVLGAVAQQEMRRLLSFHIISQIGYLLMGLGLFTPLALAGAIYFMAHVIIAKATLFLVSGAAHRISGTYQLGHLGGLYRSRPVLAFVFLVPALSLAGLPPLSGFFAKLLLVRAGIEAAQYAMVAVALAVSILTLYSMMKIWTGAFWRPVPEGLPRHESARLGTMLPPMLWLAACTLALGLSAEPLVALSMRAAESLLDPSWYVTAVLGG
ncbi:MAG: Na+/H+ antiporter subunit D [Anaerolineae bacterium]|nr:Na+/H+ antiporter subunit D [Anaerolineae bacterium]